MMNSQNLMRLMLKTTLGESVLIETIRCAAYFISRSSNPISNHYELKNHFEEGRSCYFFLQGTGLEALVEYYELNYNPYDIRAGFNYLVRHHGS